jgi:hypothetical protein
MSEHQAKKIRKSRIVVVETVHYQQDDAQPNTITHRFNRFTQTDEQAFMRLMTVGESWQSINAGWLDQVGMLVIINREGAFRQGQPTQQQRDEMAQRILEITFGSYPPFHIDMTIPPGESLRLYPTDLSRIRIKCHKGEAKTTIWAAPS